MLIPDLLLLQLPVSLVLRVWEWLAIRRAARHLKHKVQVNDPS